MTHPNLRRSVQKSYRVNTSNDVKVYNLSAGKSLPDWISDRKRRQAEKADVSLRRRIQIFQDFEMPEVSSCVRISPDGQYVVAAGAYKPRIRCYDTAEMSMKFERCMDSEVVKFQILSDDYSKMVFLQSDRFVELHAQFGKYYRLRIPKFGRDMVYLPEKCHLCIVGASRDMYRINLEEGRFESSLTTSLSAELNTCDLNPVHQLLMTGSTNGFIESWDPRSGKSEGLLNCALPDIIANAGTDAPFSVTKVKFRDALNLAVGTSTGHILLYDIRCQKPYYTKDHNYGLPIKAIEFLPEHDYVVSIDTKILKVWERENGKAVTSVEPGTELNDLCVVPNTGMMFLANEAPKILTYFIPSLGPAPKWCSFLDSLTEELEETAESAIYDDYKFVTADELENLGLGDLIGTNLLRAYMHGFFVDIRLYKKAKSIVEPFNYEDYRKQKIQEKISSELLSSRVQVVKLPKVNAALAKKFIDAATIDDSEKKKKKATGNLLDDERFGQLFKNPDFQIDTTSDDYRLLNPLVSKLDKRRQKEAARMEIDSDVEETVAGLTDVVNEEKGRFFQEGSDTSDDDRDVVAERKKQHKMIREEKKRARNVVFAGRTGRGIVKEIEGRNGTPGNGARKVKSLGRQLQDSAGTDGVMEEIELSGGNRQITFSTNRRRTGNFREAQAQHHAERRQLHRSGAPIESTLKKPWKRKVR